MEFAWDTSKGPDACVVTRSLDVEHSREMLEICWLQARNSLENGEKTASERSSREHGERAKLASFFHALDEFKRQKGRGDPGKEKAPAPGRRATLCLMHTPRWAHAEKKP